MRYYGNVETKSIGNRIFRGTLIIVFIGILAKVASFLSEAILAAFLGTTNQSDAYYIVSSVHSVIYPMMSVGIWNVFLPLYKKHIAKKEMETAYSLTNKSLTFFTLISTSVVILLFAFAPAVVSVVAPGFKNETRELCIELVRISSPMYIFIIASSVYASVLQCHERFLGSQIREVVSHIPTIIAALFLYKTYGIEVMAVALVVAGILRLLIELPFVNWGYKYKPDFKFQSQEFILMLKRLPSALTSAGVAQFNALVDKAMASMLPAGTISGLNYGHKLMNVFSGLLSSAITTAMYPQMIELIALDKKEELGGLLAKITSIFAVIMLPITFACIFFRIEIVSAVFQRGAFDVSSTTLTSSVFALYSLGLFFIACNGIISNIFYGHGDTKTPMYISIVNLGINVILNLLFIHFLGVNGLALATSTSAIITYFIRLSASRKYVKLSIKRIWIVSYKVVIASIIACGIPRILFNIITVNKYLLLLISAAIGFSVYLGMAKMLRITEINDLYRLVKDRISKK